MRRDEFESEFRRMCQANGVVLGHKRDAITDLAFEHEATPHFVNVFKGAQRNEYLMVTAGATYALRIRLVGVTLDWMIPHDALVADAWHRRGTSRGFVLDEVVLQHRRGTETFWTGFNDPRGAAGAQRDIARHNAEVAARQINGAREPTAPGGLHFDPEAPERAAATAEESLRAGDYAAAFDESVTAVDRLHDCYVIEEFRHREPSTRDAWIVTALPRSLALTRAHHPRLDVHASVRTATHRLRTITAAVTAAGGDAALYATALHDLSRLAPEVDVSDIAWS